MKDRKANKKIDFRIFVHKKRWKIDYRNKKKE